MKDAGMKTTLESSMAKLYASEVAVRCANEGVQIHGGYGFIKDYPAEKFYRDVKLCTIGEGTSEIQRLVIARQLLKRLVSPFWIWQDPPCANRRCPRKRRVEKQCSPAQAIQPDRAGTGCTQSD